MIQNDQAERLRQLVRGRPSTATVLGVTLWILEVDTKSRLALRNVLRIRRSLGDVPPEL